MYRDVSSHIGLETSTSIENLLFSQAIYILSTYYVSIYVRGESIVIVWMGRLKL